jgi:hypothetical protein
MTILVDPMPPEVLVEQKHISSQYSWYVPLEREGTGICYAALAPAENSESCQTLVQYAGSESSSSPRAFVKFDWNQISCVQVTNYLHMALFKKMISRMLKAYAFFSQSKIITFQWYRTVCVTKILNRAFFFERNTGYNSVAEMDKSLLFNFCIAALNPGRTHFYGTPPVKLAHISFSEQLHRWLWEVLYVRNLAHSWTPKSTSWVQFHPIPRNRLKNQATQFPSNSSDPVSN